MTDFLTDKSFPSIQEPYIKPDQYHSAWFPKRDRYRQLQVEGWGESCQRDLKPVEGVTPKWGDQGHSPAGLPGPSQGQRVPAPQNCPASLRESVSLRLAGAGSEGQDPTPEPEAPSHSASGEGAQPPDPAGAPQSQEEADKSGSTQTRIEKQAWKAPLSPPKATD